MGRFGPTSRRTTHTGVVYQLLADASVSGVADSPNAGRRQTLILGWYVYLPMLDGIRTADSKSIVSASFFRGPFPSSNGEAVSDAVPERKTQEVRGFSQGTIRLEFEAEVSDSPETRLLAEQRRRVIQERRKEGARLRREAELAKRRAIDSASRRQYAASSGSAASRRKAGKSRSGSQRSVSPRVSRLHSPGHPISKDPSGCRGSEGRGMEVRRVRWRPPHL